MRILLIGPTGGAGSLPPYLNVLANGLRLHGATVDRLGAPCVPYDPSTSAFWPADRIVQAAEQLLAGVDLNAYDVLSVHYGNLEIEQVLPSLWRHKRRPPAVYHVHSLDWTLFAQHVAEPGLRAVVDEAIDTMNGFIFFGTYGRDQLVQRHDITVASTVSWLPTTIPTGTRANAGQALRCALMADHRPVASLYGYAAPWKDPAGLVAACKRLSTPCQVVLAGPSWNDPTEAGIDLTREALTGAKHGAARVEVIPAYLGPGERKVLAQASHFAVFPYRTQPTFQGSGAIADYLAYGTPVLATNVANMAELVGDAGQITEPGDIDAFASQMDRLASDDQYRNILSDKAKRRSPQFSASFHAAKCLRLYESVVTARPKAL